MLPGANWDSAAPSAPPSPGEGATSSFRPSLMQTVRVHQGIGAEVLRLGGAFGLAVT
jgi:hypothetical protein